MTKTGHIKAKVSISGEVQGVFFRSSTREMARSLGLTGYVRNTPDGRVEAVFEGPGDAVRRAVDWCYQGPAGATVSSVDVNWDESSESFTSFSIQY